MLVAEPPVYINAPSVGRIKLQTKEEFAQQLASYLDDRGGELSRYELVKGFGRDSFRGIRDAADALDFAVEAKLVTVQSTGTVTRIN